VRPDQRTEPDERKYSNGSNGLKPCLTTVQTVGIQLNGCNSCVACRMDETPGRRLAGGLWRGNPRAGTADRRPSYGSTIEIGATQLLQPAQRNSCNGWVARRAARSRNEHKAVQRIYANGCVATEALQAGWMDATQHRERLRCNSSIREATTSDVPAACNATDGCNPMKRTVVLQPRAVRGPPKPRK
jgi:hypothetical protein